MDWVIRSAAGIAALACLGLAAEVNAQQCRTDSDCESGFGCRKDESVSDCAVPPSLPGEAPKVPPACSTPMPAEFGDCAPLPIVCEADDDCPDGLSCEKSDSETCASTPGGDPAPDCRPIGPTEGHCVYEPTACTSDRDCEAQDACIALGGTSTCTATPGVPCTGGSCPPPPEPTCTKTERNYCFPRRVDCTNNADCGADRRCVMLPDKIQEDAPPAWQGATQLCLEEGIALLVEGRIEAGGSVAHDETRTSASDAANGQPEAAPTMQPSRANDPGATHRRACSLAAPGGSRSESGVWLVLFGLAFGLGTLRRRR